MAQGVKDPVLSLLWHRFGPWPRNFHLPQLCGLKKKRKEKKRKKQNWVKEQDETFCALGKFAEVALRYIFSGENFLSLVL